MNDPTFDKHFAHLFAVHSPRLLRYFSRITGDTQLAADLAQEAFVRLYRRGALPENPEAWLLVVAMNLFRNDAKTRSRRLRLLTPARARAVHADAAADPAAVASPDERARVRRALERLPKRDAQLVLLQAEGYHYRELALALGLNEASVGKLLARAKQAFRAAYESEHDAP